MLAAARERGVGRVLGMRFGIEGLLVGDLVDVSRQPDRFLDRLRRTPSAILGSCRYRLRPGDAERALEVIRREDAQCLVYIGGNDSADTSDQIDRAARAAGRPLAVIGVPKTIDNDLPVTDHCPGYGSAARFVAQAAAEAGLDTAAMRRTDPIKLIEVMGRHAGWLAAAAWLAKRDERDAPHLVYVPERPRARETILTEIEAAYRRLGYCVVVLGENQPGPDGAVLGAAGPPRWTDAFGHAYYESPAQFLAREIRNQLGVRARVDKPGTLQRTSTAHHSPIDLAEAEAAGRAAVRLALAGVSGQMVTLVREGDDPYRCTTGSAPLAAFANQERRLPPDFIADSPETPNEAFLRYARPLIGPTLPEFARLDA